MNLKELKMSLSRLPGDLDDSPVVLLSGPDWHSATLLAFTGTAALNDQILIVLGPPEAISLAQTPPQG